MREHIRILGILNIALGCLTALAGVAVLLIAGGAAHLMATVGINDQDATMAAPIIATVGTVIAVFFLILAAPAIIGGVGLLNFRPWSRVLMILVSIFHLLHIPIGTALGVYGLWVLFSDDARRLLDHGGQAFQAIPGAYPRPPMPSEGTYPPRPPSAV